MAQNKNRQESGGAEKPLLSVITPAYNRKSTIMTAVNSVFTNPPKLWAVEMIIVDDGSTDGTEELFRKHADRQIKFVQHTKNQGVNAARNTAIKHAQGQYILILDSDDELVPNWGSILDEQKQNDLLGLVNFFGTIHRDTRKKMYSAGDKEFYTYSEWLGGCVNGEFSPIVEKRVFDVDLYDERRFCFEGFFWNRVIKKYGLRVIDIPLRVYNHDATNRVSKQLLDPQRAEQRFVDYDLYVKTFGTDYLMFGLKQQYAEVLRKAGLYGLLSEHISEGRRYMKESLAMDSAMTTRLVLWASYAGKKLFLLAYRFALVFVKA